MTKWTLVLGAALLLTRNAEAAQRRDTEPQVITVVPLPAGDAARTLKFQKIVTAVPPQEVLGYRRTGILCIGDGGAITATNAQRLDPREYIRMFQSEVTDARYKVVGEDVQLFQDEEASKAQLLVGAVIRGLKVDACYQASQLGDRESSNANASVDVEWQLFDQLERKVVFQTTTSGKAKTPGSQTRGEELAIHLAFAQATRALLARQDFFDIVNARPMASPPSRPPGSGDGPSTVTASATSLKLKPVPLSTARFQDQATDIRAQVATVFSGSGQGSGFFINDGYLLTNHHVVQSATFVKVRLITGREIVGEVVTSNSHRDVALVKTEPIGMKGLPVQEAIPGIGSQIFVVGSPLATANEGTVSSGIISTTRVMDDQTYIQSDVNTQHGSSGGPMLDEKGNVIAITVAGRNLDNGQLAGINFFIPIADALKTLGITN